MQGHYVEQGDEFFQIEPEYAQADESRASYFLKQKSPRISEAFRLSRSVTGRIRRFGHSNDGRIIAVFKHLDR